MRIFNVIMVFVLIIGAGHFLYKNYSETFINTLTGNPHRTMYVDNLAISVTVAKNKEDRQKGLSGTRSLDELQGKLFVFEKEDYYGIWMKDMNYPLDILWIDNNFEIIYIEEDVEPSTYPTIFTPKKPARFVLEMNSFFTESFNIKVGDRVTLNPIDIPHDLKN